MPSVHEHFSEQFFKLEKRGRGWQVYDRPVSPEPPFVPFAYRSMAETPAVDDGRRPTILSSLFRKITAPSSPPVVEPEAEEEPEPSPLERSGVVEFQASLPDKLDISTQVFEQFLTSLSRCSEPMAFELLGVHNKVTAQFISSTHDRQLVQRQLQAFFPEAVFNPAENSLETAWNNTTGDEMVAVEFGLEREFMFPLQSGKLDPFVGIIGALAGLQAGELGLFQVLWQPVRHPWMNEILDAVTDGDGRPLFANTPELTRAAESKVSSPLYAAVVRILVCADQFDRVLQLAGDLAGSLHVFARPDGNALIPLTNDDYPFEEHILDVLRRQTRRTGMLLNSDELTGFVHIPSTAVRSPVFQRQSVNTKAAPAIVQQHGVFIGENNHTGTSVPVRLSAEQRTRHVHVIGASGTGKSTLLFNLIREDILNGEGVAVLDPHGDLIDRICGIIPPERIADVVLVDPADDSYAIGFNILSAHSTLEKNLLASDLVAVFQRLSTSWGDQMNSVLQNAILAFLESTRPGTLADLRRFLVDPAFRKDFLKSVTDDGVVDYWQNIFPRLPAAAKSSGSILTRLDTFLAPKPIRYMVSQPENKLDFARIMDSGKIFLAKLPQGLLGRENSYLLGTLLMAKFQQIAMSRQAQNIAARRDFWLYIDEFANFITPSMAEILSGARKYRIGLTLAHHELHQLQRNPEVASAVMSHPYTRIVFRVGDDDARKLGEGFAFFEAQDLRNLEIGQAICRVERSDYDFNVTVPLPELPDEAEMSERRQEVVTGSRKEYGTARADVEALLAKARATPTETKDATTPFPPKPQPTQAAEVLPPPSPPLSIQPVAESKSLDLPTPTDIPVPATARAGVVKEEIPLPPLLTPTKAAETPASRMSRDLGRGGAQHQAIQKRIKEAAEKLGFRGVIEKPVPDGSVDLWLERAELSIACEISISTTIDHEVGNVAKCLKAGLPNVAVICLDDERLRKIASAVSGALGAEQAARISYFQPDPFIAHLKVLPQPTPTPTKIAGYTVKRSLPKLSTVEQRQKEDAANRLMADALRSQPKQ